MAGTAAKHSTEHTVADRYALGIGTAMIRPAFHAIQISTTAWDRTIPIIAVAILYIAVKVHIKNVRTGAGTPWE
eukprot:gene8484-biopygen14684